MNSSLRESSRDCPPLALSEFLDFLKPLDDRFCFVFSERHPMPIDSGVGIVDDRDAEDGVAFELGQLWFGAILVIWGHGRLRW